MPRSLYLAAVLVSACTAVLAVRMAAVESAAGAAYPAYSSLRADAQGLKAMFDVVEVVGRKAVRGYIPAAESGLQNTTILRLGMASEAFVAAGLPGRDTPAGLAARGNTVVLGLAGYCRQAAVKEWELALGCSERGQYLAGPKWTVLQVNEKGEAQVVERKFGTGEIVAVANSGLLNNGALARRPPTSLMALLVERRPTVFFDEEHLGVVDASSIGGLLRHYRLHGVMFAAALLFGIFVWKNTTSFLPRVEGPPEEIAGRDTTAGLANLLRRSVPRSEVISVAIAEWAKPLKNAERAREAREIASRHADPAAAYNALASIVREKRSSV